jgi:hypothetical protein
MPEIKKTILLSFILFVLIAIMFIAQYSQL